MYHNARINNVILGLGLVKQAFDMQKQSTRLYEVKTLYAGELYCWMLIREDNQQTARHWYNLFDAAVNDKLDRHPMTIDGLDSRRTIWEKLSLFERATGAAAKVFQRLRILITLKYLSDSIKLLRYYFLLLQNVCVIEDVEKDGLWRKDAQDCAV